MEFENLIRLIQAVSDSELTEFKYEENGMKLKLSKEKEQVVVASGETAQMAGAPFMYAASGTAGTAIVSTAAAAPQMAAAGQAEPKTAEEPKAGNLVQSPLVGTFYAAPAEDAKAFVSVGDHVKKGQTLAIVEAMKLMNEIESEFDGTVAEILVENGQSVEYGQSLFRIV